MRSMVKILTAALALAICACSGGGPPLPVGQQCLLGGAPIPMAADGGRQSISYAPSAHSMPPGVYVYLYADIYYTQLNVPNPLELQAHDTVVNDASTGQTLTCARNPTSTMTGIDASIDAPTDVTVCLNGAQVVNTRPYDLKVNNGTVSFVVGGKDTATTGSIDAPFTGKVFGSILLTKNPNPGEYEVRAQVGDNNGPSQFFLSVRMQFTGYAPSAEPAVCAGLPAPI
jgi:hypothetical protein